MGACAGAAEVAPGPRAQLAHDHPRRSTGRRDRRRALDPGQHPGGRVRRPYDHRGRVDRGDERVLVDDRLDVIAVEMAVAEVDIDRE